MHVLNQLNKNFWLSELNLVLSCLKFKEFLSLLQDSSRLLVYVYHYAYCIQDNITKGYRGVMNTVLLGY